jgi:hypothetical protein
MCILAVVVLDLDEERGAESEPVNDRERRRKSLTRR